MRLSKSSITKFRGDILASFSKNPLFSEKAWGMGLNYCGFRIADFGFKKSKIIHMLSSLVCPLSSDFQPPTSLYFGV